MDVLFFDPQEIPEAVVSKLGVRNASLEEVFRRADFISLHVPLVEKTRHLLDDDAFRLMKPNCIVVRTSRGPVVDEKALIRALQVGEIAGAGLDVYEREPEIDQALLEMESVVLAPHIASGSRETRLRMCMMAAENLVAGLRGERPENLVNTDVWDRPRR